MNAQPALREPPSGPDATHDPVDEIYKQRAAVHEARVQSYARTSRLVSYGRVATFLASACCFGVAVFAASFAPAPFFVASGVLLAVFLGLVGHHAKLDERLQRHSALVRLNELARAKRRRDWNAVPVPPLAPPPGHPNAEDLDLFGRASLFALLWSGGTAIGSRRLADWLLRPAPCDEASRRERAVEELAPLLDLRQDLVATAMTGSLDAHDVERFLAWAEGPTWLSRHPLAVATIVLLTAANVVLIALQIVGVVGEAYWLLPMVAAFIVSNLWAVRVEHVFDAAFAHHAVFRYYSELFALASSADVHDARLRELQAAMTTRGLSANRQMTHLAGLMRLADLRRSALLHLPVQVLTLWDFHVVLLVERWQRRAGHAARGWFDALASLEALATFAALRFDNPDWSFAQLDPNAHTVEATALAHPLLPSKTRVANDVEVGPPGTFLLVTGSNMSGKSTLLRAIGINVVLAQAGAPVCAARMRMPPVRLQTSMRVQDSLEQGVSFFMAAVQRLKQVVEAADAPGDTSPRDPNGQRLLLYLLDEVLQGTNTAERQIAVRSILRHLLARPAIGAVTTHDLSLADTRDLSSAARAVHFTEHIDASGQAQTMSFDYRLRPGIATSRNAIKLMQMVGLGVEEDG
ncbi:MAG: MutS-related protein [Bacteroidales bacterium]